MPLSPYERARLESGSFTVHHLGRGETFIGAARDSGCCHRCHQPFTATPHLRRFTRRTPDGTTVGWRCDRPSVTEPDLEREVQVGMQSCYPKLSCGWYESHQIKGASRRIATEYVEQLRPWFHWPEHTYDLLLEALVQALVDHRFRGLVPGGK